MVRNRGETRKKENSAAAKRPRGLPGHRAEGWERRSPQRTVTERRWSALVFDLPEDRHRPQVASGLTDQGKGGDLDMPAHLIQAHDPYLLVGWPPLGQGNHERARFQGERRAVFIGR